jgi:hypothetical protein
LIRFVKVVAATALMVLLVATTVSPAFAYVGQGQGSNNQGQGYGNVGGYGVPEHREESGTTTGNAGLGFACGHEDKKGEKQC